MDLDRVLESRYVTALQAADSDFFSVLESSRPWHPGRKKGEGLSDIFFPTVASGYLDAPLKVMVMGRETAGWTYPKLALDAKPRTVPEYVVSGMKLHRDFRDGRRCLDSRTSTSGLIRLLRDVCVVTSRPGLIYSNLFAVDHRCGDPRKNRGAWPHIRTLSKALLDIQIEVLQPNIIVFANGMNSATERKEFFPHFHAVSNPSAFRCTESHNWEADNVGQGHLWGFRLDDRISCYRIHHPSAWRGGSKAIAARDHLMKLLRQHGLEARVAA